MTTPRIAGNPEAIEQGFSLSVRTGPGGGRESVQTWRGTLDACRAKLAICLAAGATSVDIRQTGGSAVAEIIASFPFARFEENPQDEEEVTLEVTFKDEALPLASHVRYAGISSARIIELDKLDTAEPVGTEEESYFYYKSHGVNTYRVVSPVIVFTRTVSTRFNEALEVADAGKIFSTDQVSGFLGAPILFSVATPTSASSDPAWFADGWRFLPQMTYDADGKIKLIEQYEFGQWDIDHYSFAFDPDA